MGQDMLTVDSPVDELLRAGVLSPPASPGQLPRLNRFEIERALGVGGRGVVLRAVDTQSGVSVAIKVLAPHLLDDERARRQFVEEAEKVNRLDHAHILKILHISSDDGRPYFVMPLVEPGSLANKIQPGVPLDAGLTLSIGRQISAALKYLHSQGLIHCDIKPANVLVNQDGLAYLGDFGLQHAVYDISLLDGEDPRVGTVAYWSPAVAAGEPEDTRRDIYAFGGLLYEMLTGAPPYEGKSINHVLDLIRAAPPAPILDRNSQAPAGLVRIAEGAMARSLRDRYATMADVLADLERVDKGEEPLGPHGQQKLPARRWHRTSLLLGASALVLVGLLVVLWPKLFGKSTNGQALVNLADSPQALRLTAFDVQRYDGTTSEYLGILGKSKNESLEGDNLRLRIEFNQPAYCFVIAFHPNGQQEYYPQSEASAPPTAATTVVLPRSRDTGFGLTDGVGLQVFVVVASRQPLPAYDDWVKQEGPAPWQATEAKAVWQFDGNDFIGGPRGPERPLAGVPKPFEDVCRFLKDRPRIEAVQAIAFPVKPRPKGEPPTQKNN